MSAGQMIDGDGRDRIRRNRARRSDRRSRPSPIAAAAAAARRAASPVSGAAIRACQPSRSRRRRRAGRAIAPGPAAGSVSWTLSSSRDQISCTGRFDSHRQHRRLLDRPGLELAAIAAAGQRRVERHLASARPAARAAAARARPGAWVGAQISSRSPRRAARSRSGSPAARWRPARRDNGREARCRPRIASATSPRSKTRRPSSRSRAPAKRGVDRLARHRRVAARRSTGSHRLDAAVRRPPVGRDARHPCRARRALRARPARAGRGRGPAAPAGCPRSARRGPRHRPCRAAGCRRRTAPSRRPWRADRAAAAAGRPGGCRSRRGSADSRAGPRAPRPRPARRSSACSSPSTTKPAAVSSVSQSTSQRRAAAFISSARAAGAGLAQRAARTRGSRSSRRSASPPSRRRIFAAPPAPSAAAANGPLVRGRFGEQPVGVERADRRRLDRDRPPVRAELVGEDLGQAVQLPWPSSACGTATMHPAVAADLEEGVERRARPAPARRLGAIGCAATTPRRATRPAPAPPPTSKVRRLMPRRFACAPWPGVIEGREGDGQAFPSRQALRRLLDSLRYRSRSVTLSILPVPSLGSGSSWIQICGRHLERGDAARRGRRAAPRASSVASSSQ